MAVQTGWAHEDLAGQLHPGLPFALSRPQQDFPSTQGSQDDLQVLLVLVHQHTPWVLLILVHPWFLVSQEVLGPLGLPEYL